MTAQTLRLCLIAFLCCAPAFSIHASTLLRGTNTEPRSLDPHLGLGNSASIILNDLFEGLTTVGPDGKIVPGAAESWKVSADGLKYTFTLRADLKWSDGKALNADDFVYSFRRLLDPKTAATFASFVYPIKNAKAVNAGQAAPETLGIAARDARTVEFTLEYPAPFFVQLMAANAAAPVPRHVIAVKDKSWTEPGSFVSNGAYVMTERVPQTLIRAKKNPNFHAASSVQIDEVVFYPTEDQGATLKRFRAGELDIALNFPADQIALIEKEMPQALRVGPALSVYYLMLNHTRAPFNDARVREALSLAIDREGLVSKLLPPGSVPAYNIVPPSTSDYAGQTLAFKTTPLPERTARAKALLAEAGYGAARPLAFGFKFDTVEQNRRLGTAISSMWRGIGAQVTQDNNGPQVVDKDARTGNYDIVRWTWFAPYDDPVTFLTLLETGSSTNRATYSNPGFDALLAKARGTLDLAARRALLEEAEALALKDHAVIPIYFLGNRRLVGPRVTGWQENPRAVNLTRYLTVSGGTK
ncbi:MAG: peptide ABC transporter substrate-binding protein [Rhodospirillaceae bacterium]|nr:peptide ABC transporter substrate-binding protein [Rhodospirillaceae bacterium]